MAREIFIDEHFGESFLKIFAADGVTPAMVDGMPMWASSDETVLMPKVRPDGMSAESIEPVAPSPMDAGGIPIPARITVTADADRGAGVQTITVVSEDVIVKARDPQAAMLKFEFGPISPKV